SPGMVEGPPAAAQAHGQVGAGLLHAAVGMVPDPRTDLLVPFPRTRGLDRTGRVAVGPGTDLALALDLALAADDAVVVGLGHRPGRTGPEAQESDEDSGSTQDHGTGSGGEPRAPIWQTNLLVGLPEPGGSGRGGRPGSPEAGRRAVGWPGRRCLPSAHPPEPTNATRTRPWSRACPRGR